jgi:hypothetical protein
VKPADSARFTLAADGGVKVEPDHMCTCPTPGKPLVGWTLRRKGTGRLVRQGTACRRCKRKVTERSVV